MLIWYRRKFCRTNGLLFRYRLKSKTVFNSISSLDQPIIIRQSGIKIVSFKYVNVHVQIQVQCSCSCSSCISMITDIDIDVDSKRCWCRISDIAKRFSLIYDTISVSTLLCPKSDSVRYHSSWISDWVPTSAFIPWQRSFCLLKAIKRANVCTLSSGSWMLVGFFYWWTCFSHLHSSHWKSDRGLPATLL